MIYFRVSGIVSKVEWCLNVFMSDKYFKSLIDKINTEIASMFKWFKINKLSHNIKKYNFMLFYNKNITKV